jgi:hypothetical protein
MPPFARVLYETACIISHFALFAFVVASYSSVMVFMVYKHAYNQSVTTQVETVVLAASALCLLAAVAGTLSVWRALMTMAARNAALWRRTADVPAEPDVFDTSTDTPPVAPVANVHGHV